MYFNIVQPLVCQMVTMLHRASFWPTDLLSENVHNSCTALYIFSNFELCGFRLERFPLPLDAWDGLRYFYCGTL